VERMSRSSLESMAPVYRQTPLIQPIATMHYAASSLRTIMYGSGYFGILIM
jgi:hypothetical protein